MSSDESMMILELVVDDVELLPGVVAVSLSDDPSDPFKSKETNPKRQRKEIRNPLNSDHCTISQRDTILSRTVHTLD